MSQISPARANYQHISNIKLGQRKSVLPIAHKLAIRDIQSMLNNALGASNNTYARINLSNAYKELRTILSQMPNNS